MEETPSCPVCGCGDAEVLQDFTPGHWFSSGKAQCTHCGTFFSFTCTVAEEASE